MKNRQYDDFRCVELKTKVNEIVEEKGFYWHSFENTIFYMDETYHDSGYINQYEVLSLKKENGIVYHLLSEKIESDAYMIVHPRKRYIQSQNESLSLLLNELIESIYHYEAIEHAVLENYMVSRFKGKILTNQQKNELQISLNGLIRDDYPIHISYERVSDDRYVQIGVFRKRMNHRLQVPSLKYIQMMNVLEIIPKNEEEFLIITICGDQMLLTLDRYYEIIKEASISLQCEPLFINTNIHRILNKIKV